MRLLLDTHAFLWFVWDDPQLSSMARTAIESEENVIYLSAASPWEIAIKISIGKLSIGQDVEPYFIDHMSRNQLTLLPITLASIDKVATLPFHHKDPFDRKLIAQSIVENLPVITADIVFDRYGISRVW